MDEVDGGGDTSFAPFQGVFMSYFAGDGGV